MNTDRALDWLARTSALVSLVIAGWVLWFSGNGLDFTDEGFYLNWISDPFRFPESITQFGFIYHPLYMLMDGDIALLRQANILITWFLAWTTTYWLLNIPGESAKYARTVAFISAGMAAASLIIFRTWLLTPNYNTLAFQSLMVTSTGLFLAGRSEAARRGRAAGRAWTGPALIGIGGWMAFMAKPTTASILAPMAAGHLIFNQPRSAPRHIAIAGSVAFFLTLATAIWIDGSITKFALRLVNAIETARILGGGHTVAGVFRLDSFQLTANERIAWSCLALLTLACSHGLASRTGYRTSIALALTMATTCVAVMVPFAGSRMPTHGSAFVGLMIGAVPAGVALAAVLVPGRSCQKLHWSTCLSHGLLCLVMPFAFAIGTNGNYWQAGSLAGFFWPLGGLALAGTITNPKAWLSMAAPAAVISAAIAGGLLSTGMSMPYRQPQDIRGYHQIVELGPKHARLRLSREHASFIRDAALVSTSSGFTAETPLIDMTGQSPGLVFALGASVAGPPWNIGGYPGSEAFARKTIGATPCDILARSWLLTEPDGPRVIPPATLAVFGADMERHFKSAGAWVRPSLDGAAPVRQVLLRPTRPEQEAIAACAGARDSSRGNG